MVQDDDIRRESIGAFLRTAREKSGLTQKDVADALGYSSAQFVSNWERGVATPPLDAYPTLVKLYRVSSVELIDVISQYHEKLLDRQRKMLFKQLVSGSRQD